MAEVAKPAAATKPNPGASTKPGETGPEAKPKKEKVKRVPFPALECDKEGKAVKKLKDYPADHDPKVHLPLRRQDFENEAPLLRRQAEILRSRAAKLDAAAVDCEKLGSASTRAKAKKLRSVLEQLAKVKADLLKEGVNPDDLVPAAPAASA